MKLSLTAALLIVLVGTSAFGQGGKSVAVTLSDYGDEQYVWTGVITEHDSRKSIKWTRSNTQEFSIQVPNSQSETTLVFLKKNVVPVFRSLTAESFANGLTVEFSKGVTLTGRVKTKNDGSPIGSGVVSVEFAEEFRLPLPDVELLSWKVSEEGLFVIRGIPPGEHKVSVVVEGYMPAERLLGVDQHTQRLELDVRMSKAVYVIGKVIDSGGDVVRGRIDCVVTPPESQTTAFRTHLDNNGSFRVGPFAEEASVEFVARLSDGRTSLPVETTMPSDEVYLFVYRWVRVHGSVSDRESGEAVKDFSVHVSNTWKQFNFDDTDGRFSVEVADAQGHVTIIAPDYLTWSIEGVDFRMRDEFDLGTIMLDRAYTVEGRVVDRATREPIHGARVLKYDSENSWMRRWNSRNVRTTTDGKGEFRLKGFPQENGSLLILAEDYQLAVHELENVDEFVEIEMDPLNYIRGQVVSVHGEPVAAMIEIGSGGQRTEDGNFEIKADDGTYQVYANARTGRSVVKEVTVANGESVEGLRLVIEVVGRVHGTVQGLKEDELAQIWVAGTGRGQYDVSNGSYEIRGVAPGEYEIRARTDLNRQVEGTVVVSETMEARYDFNFTGHSSLSGRVVAGESGLASLDVWARPVDKSLPSGRSITKEGGGYLFEGLIEGTYHVEVPARDFVQTVDIQGDTYLDIELGRNKLTGHVRASGSVRGAQVTLRGGDRKRSIVLTTRVDAKGAYQFIGLVEGSYTLEVAHPEYSETSQEVEVDFDVVNVDIHLNPTADDGVVESN